MLLILNPSACIPLAAFFAVLSTWPRLVRCLCLRGRVRDPEGRAARQQRDQRHGERRRLCGGVCQCFGNGGGVCPRHQTPSAPRRPGRAGGARGVHVHGGGHCEHDQRAGRDSVPQARHVFSARVVFCSAYTQCAFTARNRFGTQAPPANPCECRLSMLMRSRRETVPEHKHHPANPCERRHSVLIHSRRETVSEHRHHPATRASAAIPCLYVHGAKPFRNTGTTRKLVRVVLS